MDRKYLNLVIKNMKLAMLLGLIFVMFSCNFIEKKGITSMKEVIEKPEIEKLVGSWVIDSFSYAFIKKHYEIGNKKVLLNINEDGGMYFKNIPDLNLLNEKKSKNADLYNLAGKWQLFQFKEEGEWFLDRKFFTKNVGLNTSLHLLYKGGQLVIVNYVGDPDEGNRLLFEKVD